MDDETFWKGTFSELPGQNFFFPDDRCNVNDKFKYKKISKFGKKFMVWQAICTCGMTARAVVVKRTMDNEFYNKQCLQKSILPLYKRHKVPPLFWPDLASCHYSKKVLEWYNANNINFVPKALNPPNCPELRPIERLWANIKRYSRKHFWASSNVSRFAI